MLSAYLVMFYTEKGANFLLLQLYMIRSGRMTITSMLCGTMQKKLIFDVWLKALSVHLFEKHSSINIVEWLIKRA